MARATAQSGSGVNPADMAAATANAVTETPKGNRFAAMFAEIRFKLPTNLKPFPKRSETDTVTTTRLAHALIQLNDATGKPSPLRFMASVYHKADSAPGGKPSLVISMPSSGKPPATRPIFVCDTPEDQAELAAALDAIVDSQFKPWWKAYKAGKTTDRETSRAASAGVSADDIEL